MRRVEAILAVAMAVTLTGCVMSGKPKVVAAAPPPPKTVPVPTPEPPSPKLSVPQTTAELPPPQPLSAEAIQSTEAAEEAPAAPAPRTRPARSRSNPASSAQRTETVGPATPPPPQPQPVESERPQIQPIVPTAEMNRLHSEAMKRRQESLSRLAQVKRRLTPQEQDTKQQVLSYMRLSEQAQKQGDMRKAYDLADKGLVLAKALADGR